MDRGDQGRVSPLLLRALAGLQAGVLGGVAMLACLAAFSGIGGRPIWIVPNLFGALFYDREVLRAGFDANTLAGLAVLVFLAGLIGILFGVAVRGTWKRLRVALLGVLCGLAWYYLSEAFLWRRFGVLGAVYGPPRSLMLAHLIYGSILASYPSGLDSLRRHFSGDATSAAGPGLADS
jgi:hypothetical protein